MTQVLGPFPDAEALTRAVLQTLTVEGLQVGNVLPPDLQGTYGWLPFLRVTCIGGADNHITDTSRVDVDAFASDKDGAGTLAEQARQVLTAGPCSTDEGVLDHSTTVVKPNQVPYGDETRVVRYTAAYSITARRRFRTTD
jgi:hypothetical protein